MRHLSRQSALAALAPVLVLMLVLAACAHQAPQRQWTIQTSATAGTALVLTEGGGEALRLACRRNPADLLLVTPRLPAHAGPVTLRIGDAAFGLQGNAEAPVLAATGPLPGSLPEALLSARQIAVRQGAANAQFEAPDAATAAAFAAACGVGAPGAPARPSGTSPAGRSGSAAPAPSGE